MQQTDKLLKLQRLDPANAPTILVEPGNKDQTIQYYARIQKLIGLDLIDDNNGVRTLKDTDLTKFLTYLGFTGLSANDIERLGPQILMPQTHADFERLAQQVDNTEKFLKNRELNDFENGNVLVSRFFAPKIVNFNLKNLVPDSQNIHTPGWRKLVRLRALDQSAAARAGITAAYVLFNVFEGDEKKNPFRNESVNNQVILVPKKVSTSATPNVRDSIFWLLYFSRSKGYRLGDALNVGFDLPQLPEKAPTKDYFVPVACAQCHGHDNEYGNPVRFDAQEKRLVETDVSDGVYPFGKVNYLDTDQWYDMAEYDFPGTKNGPFDVVFDGGKGDRDGEEYEDAFDILRELNGEIAQQNRATSRPEGSDLFKIRAVEKWIALHRRNNHPAKPADRALDLGSGIKWRKSSAEDQGALKILNRYCFRCHSSMYWSVFDKSFVVGRGRDRILGNLRNNTMPQGRIIAEDEEKKLVDYLNGVK